MLDKKYTLLLIMLISSCFLTAQEIDLNKELEEEKIRAFTKYMTYLSNQK